ncbi:MULTISPECIES: ABC transporter permease [unclassified Microbacterium]|uniref:ABC transporter permease n=1 Tax=unclassified Microbacterium TaxID=2609290 RepID=UPI00214BA3C6|nr:MULTISPECIES: ABC transporter permease [unclassified Microbacterium]MCR2808395.1 ABC transporter permease [Microbacterium sp. zg.B185]WIM19159.1 ABC transporter permease [Microbacterium sp. zg-B185]
MTATLVTATRVNQRGGALRRFVRAEPIGIASLVFIAIIVIVAVFAQWIAPYSSFEQHREAILEPPSGEFLLGTDWLGRDQLSRIIYGGQTSLVIAVSTTLIGGLLGVLIGMVSGYLGGVTDLTVQRIADAIESIPPLVLLLLIAAIMGPSIPNTIFALMVMLLPGFNRVARGEVIRLKQERYIEASRSVGAKAPRLVLRHILPNMAGPLLTVATLRFAGVIVAESALSFLGLGPAPPTPSWGGMLSSGVQYLSYAPWLIVYPAFALALAVLAFNLFGDSLRDYLDPRLTRRG